MDVRVSTRMRWEDESALRRLSVRPPLPRRRKLPPNSRKKRKRRYAVKVDLATEARLPEEI